ncbi:hypothetical protein D3C86_1913430 [compost metagenome]
MKGNSKVRLNKSKLRKLAEKLQEREDVAIALLDRSLNEQDVGAESLSSAKWLLSAIVTMTRSASQDELGNFQARLKGKRDEAEIEEPTVEEVAEQTKPRLSLVYVDPNEDDDE